MRFSTAYIYPCLLMWLVFLQSVQGELNLKRRVLASPYEAGYNKTAVAYQRRRIQLSNNESTVLSDAPMNQNSSGLMHNESDSLEGDSMDSLNTTDLCSGSGSSSDEDGACSSGWSYSLATSAISVVAGLLLV